ncbi:DsbA family oxidoreductase [bacterium LRH843]|nr:DsbA family oxidoreductase [bacterium LRH843]
MNIEVWSDFVCPFCYIGKRRLEEALKQFPHTAEVEVEYKSYELDPHSPKDIGKNMYELLASKYGMSVVEAKKNCAAVGEQASSVGLTYHFDSMIPTNTFDAHRLVKFAKSKGKDAELTETLLHAYFTDAKHIGEYETLVDLAASVGMNKEEASAVLEDESSYAAEVREDIARAQQIGVRGVPFFVINNKYAISGAQPLETFVGALNKAWEEQ